MNTQRADHLAAALPDGSVVVVGGTIGSDRSGDVERYFPGAGNGTGEWRRVPSYTTTDRVATGQGHQLVSLDGGRLLLSGPATLTSPLRTAAHLYNAATNAWTAAPGCGGCSFGHRAVALGNGLVLVAGGAVSETAAQLYSPAANSWSPAAQMNHARNRHSATRLLDGRVLVTGGNTSGSPSYELYVPALGAP